MKTARLFLSAVLLLGFAACAKNESIPAPAVTKPPKHEHQPPHGGTPVVLGKENFHLELVRDAAAGTLTAYVLDRHMAGIVRLEAPTIELQATAGGVRQTLVLNAVPNPLSSETVGDTSVFTGQADWLKNTPEFAGVFPEISVRGLKFEQVAFQFPAGNDQD